MGFDSIEETQKHIDRVRQLIGIISNALILRGEEHDQSKLNPPEKNAFDEVTPKLKGSTYGSEEYNGFLKDLAPILKHHYENNRHHPEHYANGISGMTLIDIIELFCDWKAASERHENGNMQKSIEINSVRFSIDKQLVQIFENTRTDLGL